MADALKVEILDGVAHVRLDRRAALNALDADLAVALAEGLGSLTLDRRVKAVILSGEGRAFCSGGDLRWALAFPGGAAAGLHHLAGAFHRSIVEIRRMPKPVIAAINGVAAGAGFSLALACDFRVMAEAAVLRQAYTTSGLSIDGGGTFTLPRLVGLARALEIAAFDPVIDARAALEWGLVNRVSQDAEAEAEAMARQLLGRSLTSFAWSKRLLGDAFDRPLEVQLERERAGIVACAGLPDGEEGIRAFTEKRKPVFGRAP
jgi:2-(1,2-epoxy-1,2-dihydrophenyl)acetyl-CoA isomerase